MRCARSVVWRRWAVLGCILCLFPGAAGRLLVGASPEYGDGAEDGVSTRKVAPRDEFAKALRYPVDLEMLDGGETLLVINQRSGSVSLIDAKRVRVIGEQSLGKRLSDVAKAGDWILVTDEHAHELLLMRREAARLKVVQRLPVSPYPVKLVVSENGTRCWVASLWSRRVSQILLPTDEQPRARVEKVRDMPFAPREMLYLADKATLLVADAFGGRLAIVKPDSLAIERVREFPAHNVRGLGVSEDGSMLILTHQMLNSLAHTVRNDVHWGLLMSNDLRWLKLENVLGGDEDLYRGAHMHPLGEAGSAAGDPAGFEVAADGTVVAALAGVDQLAIGVEDDFSLLRLRVGRRPMAVRICNERRLAYVVNMFSDSVSVVDLKKQQVTHEISLGAQRALTKAEQGEQLFYDARISHDGWMSCHSCHTDGHTNGMLNDNFSDESFGAPKRVLSLLGREGTGPFAWNAIAPDLETQVAKSIERTMQSDDPPEPGHVEALAAFVRTLEPPPPIDQLRDQFDRAQVARGKATFERLRCANCHAPPTYTTPRTYDVGLHDEKGNRQFNPPSLRGLGQRGPYFHDNRAKSLADVFVEYGHRLREPLDDNELADLLAFLRSL